MQQDFKDKNNEIIIEVLESKINDFEASLEKKDFLLQAAEGSLMEAQAESTKLSEELSNARATLKENQSALSKKEKNCKQNPKPKLLRIQSCRNH
jgi:chromosome segregation ATPase